MVIIEEERVSFSDNSHLAGIPFIIHLEEHAFVEVTRDKMYDYLQRLAFLPLEFHIDYRRSK